jgi:hypothetical protein
LGNKQAFSVFQANSDLDAKKIIEKQAKCIVVIPQQGNVFDENQMQEYDIHTTEEQMQMG